MNDLIKITRYLCILLLSTTATWAAEVVYVDADAPGVADGTTWCNAFTNLQDALGSTNGSDTYEFRIAQGVYTPAEPGGSRIASFALQNNVSLMGGYAGCGATNPNARDINSYETLLSGDLNQDDNSGGSNAENSYHILTGNGVDSTAVLDGLTISGAFANGPNPSDRGGGLFLFPSASSPTINRCTFHNNITLAKGSAIYAFLAEATVTDCQFIDNHSNDGGAVYVLQGSTTFSSCLFQDNSATSLGGAMFSLSSAPLIDDCIFENNSAIGGGALQIASSPATIQNTVFRGNEAAGGGLPSGGAILVQDSAPYLTNSLFDGNVAGASGGGVHHMLGSNSEIRNCTFVYNEANNGGAVSGSGSDIVLASSILWNNTAANGAQTSQLSLTSGTLSVLYSCVQGLPAQYVGNGNIDVDPVFINDDGPDGIPGTADDNLRLDSDSPCIDAGEPESSDALPAVDLDGNNRTTCRGVDMGAFEHPDASSCLGASVPAVSTWGIVILALLILTVARVRGSRFELS